MSKAIKDKMDKLDTLSGGIVFGKEDAWGRLQGRLEQKPARKIPLGYKIATAAAAVLAIVICISVFYSDDQQTVTAVATKPVLPHSIVKTTEPVSKNTKAIATVQAIETKPYTPVGVTEHAAPPVAIQETEQPEVAANDPTALFELSAEVAGITIKEDIAIVPAPKSKMRVVHINEIDEEPQQPSYASAKPATKEMKVVTAQDEWSREQEAIIQRNTRPHGSSPFFSLPGRHNSSTAREVPMASNPFSIKLSIQN